MTRTGEGEREPTTETRGWIIMSDGSWVTPVFDLPKTNWRRAKRNLRKAIEYAKKHST